MHNTVIENTSFDQERALYGINDALVRNVRFAGPADGESALKECGNIEVRNSIFELRYPFWHTSDLELLDSELTSTCRASLWYASNVHIERSRLWGIKALRECDDVTIADSNVDSQEFGWSCRNVALRNTAINSEYAFLHARDLTLTDCTFSGKYSFQYVENLTIEGGVFDTKDAFWHAHNVCVRNATLKGEYLGWYSDGLTLIYCRIEGTQPLVHCRNLTLVGCTMVGCDLAFEGSDVQAVVYGHVDSIRDPKSGRIEVGSVGEIVHDTLAGCGAQIVVGAPCDQGKPEATRSSLCVHTGKTPQSRGCSKYGSAVRRACRLAATA